MYSCGENFSLTPHKHCQLSVQHNMEFFRWINCNKYVSKAKEVWILLCKAFQFLARGGHKVENSLVLFPSAGIIKSKEYAVVETRCESYTCPSRGKSVRVFSGNVKTESEKVFSLKPAFVLAVLDDAPGSFI